MTEASNAAGVRVAIDTGGTFTDVAVGSPDGGVLVCKVPSSPEAPDDAVLDGLRDALSSLGLEADSVQRFAHGTTIATNALLTRAGARVGLVTTEGFADLLTIGRQARPSLYDPHVRPSEPLIDDRLIWEVPERLSADGSELAGIVTESLEPLVEKIRFERPDVVVVSFLNAYANPAHEDDVVHALQKAEAAPSVYSATSITPEMREYERTSTAVVNGFVQPKVGHYLERLERRLAQLGVPAQLWVMQSNGGLLGAQAAQSQSVRTILSGLASGVVGAGRWARQLELKSVVSFDMGGTSSDISLIRNGSPEEVTSTEVAGHSLRIPAVDVHTIGAGGGSIAWRDTGGGLRAGPHSAGAIPGPVCYARGGSDLTVTDAHALLGRLGDTLLDGRLQLDVDRARGRLDAFAREIVLPPYEAAEGILRVITATMARGVRKVSVERGVDPRDCTLMAFGGAGPLHAADLIRELDMRAAVIPPHPGIASAVGMLDAPIRHDFSRNISVSGADDLPAAKLVLDELAEEAAELVMDDGAVTAGDVQIDRHVDARYRGQSYELDIPWTHSFKALRTEFDRRHAERYGFDDPEADLEVITARVTATAAPSGSASASATAPTQAPTPVAERPVYFDGQWHDTPVYRRTELPSATDFTGPLIVEQLDSTVVVGVGQRCRNDDNGFLHLFGADK